MNNWIKCSEKRPQYGKLVLFLDNHDKIFIGYLKKSGAKLSFDPVIIDGQEFFRAEDCWILDYECCYAQLDFYDSHFWMELPKFPCKEMQ